jgi:agmatine deiminase
MVDEQELGGSELSRRSFLTRSGLAVAGLAAAGTLADVGWATSPAAAATWRVPGEDHPHKRTWMAWPSSTAIWGSQLLPKIQGDIAKLAKEIAKHEPVIMCADGTANAAKARSACGGSLKVIGSIPVNDCWMRDSGPLLRINRSGGRNAIGLDFNGWGGKQIHGKDKYVAQRVAAFASVRPFTKADVVGEGGGIEYDGDGTLMATTSCWVNFNRNPGKTKAQIGAELLRKFGARKMIWVPGIKGKDITDLHVDSVARYVRPGVVLVQLPPSYRRDIWADNARQVHRVLSNATDAKGRRLQVLTIEGPDEFPRWPRNRWNTFLDSYVNWVVTNGSVITAQFGDTTKDAAAKAAIGAAFPGRTVVQLNLDQLHGEGGGGAHCVTMQEPRP